MLGEKPVLFEIIAMACSFAGILMIMSSKFTDSDKSSTDDDKKLYVYGCVLCLIVSVASAFIGIYIRKM